MSGSTVLLTGASGHVGFRTLRFLLQHGYNVRAKPDFDAIHIFPTYVVGRNEQTKTVEEFKFGSNWIAIGTILGHKEEQAKPAVVISLDDVALAHVRALDPKVKGNQNFLLSSGEKIQWEDAKDIVRKHFPKEVEQGLLPLDGSQAGATANMDSSKSLAMHVLPCNDTLYRGHKVNSRGSR
ncbi:hypothetical protein KVT40_002532 [Elsinoe batatas]|uniref:NAD-dependent epimerase/dehydratase domain-containing protein n=1 Tax=Elsinoe batatas TaxID=2601811 RepID=A0A8K0PHL7_9PEZI|nr:hypothetical protein KVT40_002532 [Elsinoe batatas]